MSYAQTNYIDTPIAGYAGLVANGETSNRISRTVEDATAIPFGKPVFRGSGDHGVTATPNAATLLGITIANTAGQDDSHARYATAAILTQGVIWVTATGNVADGDQAYVSAGNISNSNSGTILTGWFFQDTLNGGGLVRLAKR